MDISLNICPPEIKFYTGIHNNLLKGSMSQIFDLVLILCQKTGNFWSFFKTLFSRFHRMKTKA